MRQSPFAVLASATKHFMGIVVVAAIAGLLVAGLALPLIGATSVAARSTVESFNSLPADFEAAPQAQRSVIVDSEGKRLAVFFDEFRIYKPLDEIAPVMQQAMVAIEDARFYEHGPIDLQATARALVTNVSSGSIEQGGSTLTQQYVKNVLVTQAEDQDDIRQATETSYSRKLRELRLSMAAEEQFTKDQILERYLNIANFGGGAYGVEAAARRFYSTTADKLTLNQAATLAGLVQSPTRHNPETFPERAITRRNAVLAAMVHETESISAKRADKVAEQPLNLKPALTTNGCMTSYAPFFCDYVFRELMDWKGLGRTVAERERNLRRGGLRIETTLSQREQEAAERAVSGYVAPTDRAIGALAMVEPGTGHITALAQSQEYGSGPGRTFLNYATDSDRGSSEGFQNGSTMKPFVLAAAIKQGLPLNYSIDAPAKITHTGPMRACDGKLVWERWEVGNYDEKPGEFTLRTGTWRSVNTFYALLQERTGICMPWQIATDAGLRSSNAQDVGKKLAQVKSFVLGSQNISPLGLAEAYAMFAARGTHCRAIAVTSIKTPTGEELSVPSAKCSQVLESGVADAVNQVLADVINGPDPARTGANMSLGSRPAAGKTGTTDNAEAIWFAGYTPQRSAAVVVAHPDRPRSLHNIVLNGVYYDKAFGGRIPGPMWRQAMSEVMAPMPSRSFTAPDPKEIAGVPLIVPDVRGMTGVEAVQTLNEAGFSAYVAAQVNSSTPYGLTVYTSPGTAATHYSGGTVQVFTSTGYVPPPPKPAESSEPEPKKPAPKKQPKKKNR